MALPGLKNENEDSEGQVTESDEERLNIIRDIIDNNLIPNQEFNEINNESFDGNERGESIYVLCQNDPSTIETPSTPTTVLMHQTPPLTQQLRCTNTENLCSLRNEDRPNISSRRVLRRGRVRWWWPRRRGSPMLRSSPEQINVRIPVEGSLSYRNNYPPQYDATLPLERNAPPIYSTKMSSQCPYDIHCSSFITPMPPPSYAETMGSTEMDLSPDPVFELRFSTVWSHRRQAAFCLVCRSMVFTSVKHRVTRFTHMSALTLCILGCWPCCFLPYFFNYFKTTYHYCPTCRTCLGSYSILDQQ